MVKVSGEQDLTHKPQSPFLLNQQLPTLEALWISSITYSPSDAHGHALAAVVVEVGNDEYVEGEDAHKWDQEAKDGPQK